jgi:hypothetical protein
MSSKVNIWVIVGEGDAGKSTTVRALTGARDQELFSIAAAGGGIIPNTFIMPTSLQEFGVLPADFISRVAGNYWQRKGAGPVQPGEFPFGMPFDNVLLSLRENAMNGCPAANDYLAAFAAAGWHVQSPIINLAMSGPSYRAPAPHITLDVDGGPGVPANRKASAIRAAWGWL